MPFDEAINVDESKSVKSDEDEDEKSPPAPGVQVQAQQRPPAKGTSAWNNNVRPFS